MKVTIEIDPDGQEEIVIRVKEANAALRRLNDAITSALARKNDIAVKKGDAECYLSVDELLFFEANGKSVYAHTARDCFTCPLHLSELERLLPGSFARASKSVIVNTAHVRSLDRSPTGIAKATFRNSEKTVYISRMYFKTVRETIEETRLK